MSTGLPSVLMSCSSPLCGSHISAQQSWASKRSYTNTHTSAQRLIVPRLCAIAVSVLTSMSVYLARSHFLPARSLSTVTHSFVNCWINVSFCCWNPAPLAIPTANASEVFALFTSAIFCTRFLCIPSSDVCMFAILASTNTSTASVWTCHSCELILSTTYSVASHAVSFLIVSSASSTCFLSKCANAHTKYSSLIRKLAHTPYFCHSSLFILAILLASATSAFLFMFSSFSSVTKSSSIRSRACTNISTIRLSRTFPLCGHITDILVVKVRLSSLLI